MNMPFEEGNDLIKFALNEEDDEKMFFRWAIAYQSQMSFDDFKNCIRAKSIDDNRNSEDILKTVEQIMKRF